MKLRFPVNREGDDDLEAERIIGQYATNEEGIKRKIKGNKEEAQRRLEKRLEKRKQEIKARAEKIAEDIEKRREDLKSKRCFLCSEYRWSRCCAVRQVRQQSSCTCPLFGRCGECCRGEESYCAPFITLNIIAAVLHLVNTVFALILSSESSRENDTKLKRIVTKWTEVSDYCNETCNEDIPYYAVNGTGKEFVLDPFTPADSISLNLFWLVVWFHFLSFLFQIWVARSPNYVTNVLEKGTNSWRFVEYSISASIMLVCIALVSGILEVNMILSITVLTFITQILGLISEQLFQDGIENQEVLRYFGWIAHFGGWVTMLTAYIGIIIVHFLESVEESITTDVEVPEFVYVIVWSIFLCYNLFGLTAISQLCLKDPWCSTVCARWCGYRPKLNSGRDKCSDRCTMCRCGGYDRMSVNEWVEMFYVILSLVSKTILGWLILVNTLEEEQRFGELTLCNYKISKPYQ